MRATSLDYRGAGLQLFSLYVLGAGTEGILKVLFTFSLKLESVKVDLIV